MSSHSVLPRAMPRSRAAAAASVASSRPWPRAAMYPWRGRRVDLRPAGALAAGCLTPDAQRQQPPAPCRLGGDPGRVEVALAGAGPVLPGDVDAHRPVRRVLEPGVHLPLAGGLAGVEGVAGERARHHAGHHGRSGTQHLHRDGSHHEEGQQHRQHRGPCAGSATGATPVPAPGPGPRGRTTGCAPRAGRPAGARGATRARRGTAGHGGASARGQGPSRVADRAREPTRRDRAAIRRPGHLRPRSCASAHPTAVAQGGAP